MKEISMTINGKVYSATVNPAMRLLDLLRDVFLLTGTKEGCAEGECGACTVIMDGETVNSCLVLAGQADGHELITIEGAEGDEIMELLQKTFIEAGAVQCGFCTPGMILSAKVLLMKNPHPTTREIKEAISGNLCRCTGYTKIVKAVKMAAENDNG
jgi:aerobic-type carbon monoxide dehydrogenase small subunit (CoxS/CutS family)